MDIFDVLTLIGGLCLFLFGMNQMGDALERRAGSGLQALLGRLTTGKLAGLLTGIGVTAVIQSSSATTVMVVGFVNSGLMTLKQAINVIMGANIGTTVTAWILSLGGIEGDNIIVQLLKPMSFTPILALIGTAFVMFSKKSKAKDTGMILLGFTVLMFGMDIMSDAVSGLKDVPAFRDLFLMFENPILGVLAGALLTAVIQSSSASVGILQALSVTGQISFGAAIPIIMGQNIGTCVTAILSSLGTNRNAKRAALVHLLFNVLGTTIWLSVFAATDAIFSPALLGEAIDQPGIAVAHSVFNILCMLLLLPCSSLLEKLAYTLIPEAKQPEAVAELDERLMTTPSVALERCHVVTADMADSAVSSLCDAISCLYKYDADLAERVRARENETDHYEDIIGTYLVKLSTLQIGDHNSAEASKILKVIGDLERIADHAVNLVESAEELRNKELSLSEQALSELRSLTDAIEEILHLSATAFRSSDMRAAAHVEPLEQIIDTLKERMRTGHIRRLQEGLCSIETGFVWSDILTNLERTSDHCSNIAGCVIDAEAYNLNLHESLRATKTEDAYKEQYAVYAKKYLTAK